MARTSLLPLAGAGALGFLIAVLSAAWSWDDSLILAVGVSAAFIYVMIVAPVALVERTRVEHDISASDSALDASQEEVGPQREAEEQVVSALGHAAAEMGSHERQALRSAVGQLPYPERRILELRYGLAGERMTIEAIAEDLGMTSNWVRKSEQTALQKLGRALYEALAADSPASDSELEPGARRRNVGT
jgi:RNA polymerase sigma factor (sigma-70 family)